MPGSALARMALYVKIRADQAGAVLHANQSTSFFGGLEIETFAVINDLDVGGGILGIGLEVDDAALCVFDDVCHGLTQHGSQVGRFRAIHLICWKVGVNLPG